MIRGRGCFCSPDILVLSGKTIYVNDGNGREESALILFYVLKIFVCSMTELFASGFIAYDDTVLVHLEDGDGPLLRYGTFDCSLQST